jgi:hypothetical protein
MDLIKKEILSRGRKHSYKLWKETTIRLERIIYDFNRNNLSTLMVSLFDIPGIPKDYFDSNLIYLYGNIVITNKSFEFIEEVKKQYNSDNLLLLEIIKMRNAKVHKVLCSTLLQFTIMEGNIDKYKYELRKSMISPYIIPYINSKYYLPIIYRCLLERRTNFNNYISEIEIKLSHRLPDEYSINGRDNDISNYDIISGLSAGAMHLGLNPRKYPITTIFDGKTYKKKDDMIELTTDHPVLERYFKMYLIKSGDKIIANGINYAEHAICGIVVKDGVTYTDMLTTLIILHIIGWFYERNNNPTFEACYGMAKKLREIESIDSIPIGVYYGDNLWRGYF